MRVKSSHSYIYKLKLLTYKFRYMSLHKDKFININLIQIINCQRDQKIKINKTCAFIVFKRKQIHKYSKFFVF